jgi:hypothetical protein
MRELGFANVDWRKGTPLDESPADQGRDIQAQRVRALTMLFLSVEASTVQACESEISRSATYLR